MRLMQAASRKARPAVPGKRARTAAFIGSGLPGCGDAVAILSRGGRRVIGRILIGVGGGLAVTVAILVAARWVLYVLDRDKVYALEHGVVYTTLVLGAGFGAVCAAILSRERPPS